MSSILVVDDEPLVVRVVVFSLQRAGYSVVSAADPEEALAFASRNPGAIRLLILDHSLHGGSRTAFLDKILVSQPWMKVLHFSGHSERELRERGEIPENALFLQKPFKPGQLVDCVRAAIGDALQ